MGAGKLKFVVSCFAGRACLCKDKMGEQRPSEKFQTACLCNDDLLIGIGVRDFKHRLQSDAFLAVDGEAARDK